MVRFNKAALGAAFVAALSLQYGAGVAHAAEMTEAEKAQEESAAADVAKEIDEASKPYAPPDGSSSFKYEAEVNKMLDIVVNSLYTNKDVFLRELISNASDALDKIRFLSVTEPELLGDVKDLEVKIEFDADNKTLTIRDTGVGMSKDELVKNLGTVAKSGTTDFMKALGDGAADMSMIGMFGVGFYSTFLVADRVSVASKVAGEEQHIWESLNGEASFHVGPDPRGETLGRGTEITLHLKEDAEEYLSPYKLKEMIRHYSEFVTHPVSLKQVKTVMVPKEKDEFDEDDASAEEKEGDDDIEVSEEGDDEPEMEEVTTIEWEQINTDPAIWARGKDSITDEEYQEFWKVVSKGQGVTGDAEDWTHFNAEGNINFKSILYMPSEVPSALSQGQMDQMTPGLRLYVRKVLISDEFDLMPRYLSFIRGVVDSDDLPLNVNRETLQESKIIKIIQKKLVRKAIEMIRKLSNTDTSKDSEEAEIDADGNVVIKDDEEDKEDAVHPYITWYKKFGLSLKMGAIDDTANRDKLQKLLRFKSNKADGEDDFVSLKEYIENMKEWQKEIYVLPGETLSQLKESSFMDAFNDRDVEVLYLTDAMDEYYISNVREFDGKKFRDITKEGVKFGDEDEDMLKRRNKVYTETYKPLTKYLKKLYGMDVARVAVSKRLGKSPAILSSSEWGNSANMDRIMRAQAFAHGVAPGESNMPSGILEINPRHPFVAALLEGLPANEEDTVSQSTKDAAWILLDMATMSGGFPIRDTKKYAQRMTRVLQSNLGVASLTLADEIDPPEEVDEPDEPEFEMPDFDMADLEDLDM